MFYTRLSEIVKTRNKSITSVLLDLGLSKGNIARWRNGATVNSDVLIKIADHFDVSTDYLLGRTDNPEVNR